MIEIEHKSYFPLRREDIDRYVPSRAGICVLAVRLANGVHKPIHSIQSDNLYRFLIKLTRHIPGEFPPYVMQALKQFQCYFTFVVAESEVSRVQLNTMMNDVVIPSMV